jgi:hypothetical protein
VSVAWNEILAPLAPLWMRPACASSFHDAAARGQGMLPGH